MYHAILLSGDRPGDMLAEISPGHRKALLPLCDRPMILYVIEILLASHMIERISIVANNVVDFARNPDINGLLDRSGAASKVDFIEGAGSPAASVLKAMAEVPADQAVLVTTADNPLLSLATLEQFCEGVSLVPGLEVAVGLARESDIRKAFPNSKRTFIRLAKAGYSGCNLFVLMPGTGEKAAQAWQAVEGRRKKPWQLILHFGVFTLFRAVIGLLDLDRALEAASRTLGLRAKAIILDDAVAAMDVDKIEHISIAESVLAGRKGASQVQTS